MFVHVTVAADAPRFGRNISGKDEDHRLRRVKLAACGRWSLDRQSHCCPLSIDRRTSSTVNSESADGFSSPGGEDQGVERPLSPQALIEYRGS